MLQAAARPERLSKRASFSFLFGLFELLTVAVLQCRSGHLRILRGRMGPIRRIILRGEMDVGEMACQAFSKLK